ncbi:thioredoxin family protein [Parabacteroides sp. OttesenSCG-928-G06]|nr:thioredoxin family protein [Parabacteroides sp. OttesenSCG-928-G06]
MKVRTYVLIGLVSIIFISSGSKEARPTVGINPGDIAPGIESLKGEKGVDFQNHSKRYTLVNFWAAYDAESRAGNVRLMHAINHLGSKHLDIYSISLDVKESVFHETVKCDGLDITQHFQVEPDKQSSLRKAYKLDQGLNSYLIDDKGMIIASGLTPEKLAKVLRTI